MSESETKTENESGEAGGLTVAVDGLTVRYGSTTSQPQQNRKRSVLPGRRPTASVAAIRNFSFVAREGDFIGLVGRNGSGKSTLLRAIAGLEVPSRGSILASAQPQFLGVNAALIPDLSGEQNALLGCLAMGMSPDEADRKSKEIAEFSGLGAAIYRPMKTYSSGMGARLKFSISLANRPEILLVDEALSTGDAAFQDKSREAMEGILSDAGTVFLVSHAAQMVEEMCKRAMWIDSGRLVIDGDAEEVARMYRWYAHNLAQGETEKAGGLLADAFAEGRARRHENKALEPDTEPFDNTSLTVSEEDAAAPADDAERSATDRPLDISGLRKAPAQVSVFPATIPRPNASSEPTAPQRPAEQETRSSNSEARRFPAQFSPQDDQANPRKEGS